VDGFERKKDASEKQRTMVMEKVDEEGNTIGASILHV